MVSENKEEYTWYRNGAVEKLIATEEEELSKILPTLYGYHLVLLGEQSFLPVTKTSLIPHRILLHPKLKKISSPFSGLKGEWDALPLGNESVDVVILSHVLEHARHPHQILREVQRVLIPEGHVVITGFNPFSCWGLWHLYQRIRSETPPYGKLLTAARIRDWLKLLNFQIIEGRSFYFRPPLVNEGLHRRLAFLEKGGKMVWPFWGGIYMIVAVKRVIPFTLVRPIRAEKRLWQPAEGLPKPTTTNSLRK